MNAPVIERIPYNDWRPHNSVAGAVEVWPNVLSPQLGNARNVVVYLPPSYARSRKRYHVLYMHDGQNLFDRGTSFAGAEWQVDETMEALAGEGNEGREAIVVGIWNTEARLSEYNPFSNWWQGTGEAYLAFITETLKPQIDAAYRTRKRREHTGIIGSSMGGLISLYAFFKRPDVFGLVGAMSPAFWIGSGIAHEFVRKAPFVPGRIYMDHGSREYSPTKMRDVLRAKGYTDADFLYVKEDGGEHNESAWARRFPEAAQFLLR
jgi:predicted alpha/beta superfamily hydrolase